jgi:hypothetical protein
MFLKLIQKCDRTYPKTLFFNASVKPLGDTGMGIGTGMGMSIGLSLSIG